MSEIKHSNRGHALLSASGSKRWLNCTRSVRASEKIKSSQSTYAAEGELAHELCELLILHEIHAIDDDNFLFQLEKIRQHNLYAKEMRKYADSYVEIVIDTYEQMMKEDNNTEIYVELVVDYEEYAPDGFGTCDVVIIGAGKIVIIDLKYGRGVKVDAPDNSQLRLYALGAYSEFNLIFDIQTVNTVIIQPRLHHVSTEVMPIGQLLDWGENEVKPKALKAYKGRGVFMAGSWCRWCPIKATCKEHAKHALHLTTEAFAEPYTLETEELAALYQHAQALSLWLKGVEEYLHDLANSGETIPGMKLGHPKGRRYWINEKEVVKALRKIGLSKEEYYDIKLKGITKIEGLLSQDDFETELAHLIGKKYSKPKLVAESSELKSIAEIFGPYSEDD